MWPVTNTVWSSRGDCHSESDFEGKETDNMHQLVLSEFTSDLLWGVSWHPQWGGRGKYFLTFSSLKEGEPVINRHPSWGVRMWVIMVEVDISFSSECQRPVSVPDRTNFRHRHCTNNPLFLIGVECYFIMVLICTSLATSTNHFGHKHFACWFVICTSSLMKNLFKYFPQFLIALLVFLFLSLERPWYVAYISFVRYMMCKYFAPRRQLDFAFC